MGCLRTLHHISHLLIPRKCQLLLQEKPFGVDATRQKYVILSGASKMRSRRIRFLQIRGDGSFDSPSTTLGVAQDDKAFGALYS